MYIYMYIYSGEFRGGSGGSDPPSFIPNMYETTEIKL